VRVYLPATLAQLARWHAGGEVPADVEPVRASDDSEDSEYLALMTAADLSAAQLDGPGRRVVVVAEVGDRSRAVPMSRVVAIHVDTEDVTPEVAGEEDAPDLGWFATQEIGDLIG
jgi:hypothetical protein